MVTKRATHGVRPRVPHAIRLPNAAPSASCVNGDSIAPGAETPAATNARVKDATRRIGAVVVATLAAPVASKRWSSSGGCNSDAEHAAHATSTARRPHIHRNMVVHSSTNVMKGTGQDGATSNKPHQHCCTLFI